MQLKLSPFIHAKAITMTDVCKRIRSDTGKQGITLGLLFRWCTRGYKPRGWHGDRLRMPSVVLGGRRWIMPEWIDAFEQERIRMGMMLGAREPAKMERPAPVRRAKEIERAKMRLRKAGLMK